MLEWRSTLYDLSEKVLVPLCGLWTIQPMCYYALCFLTGCLGYILHLQTVK